MVFWKRLSSRQLNIAVQTFSLIAIFFEGYDQVRFLHSLVADVLLIDEIGSHGRRKCQPSLCHDSQHWQS